MTNECTDPKVTTRQKRAAMLEIACAVLIFAIYAAFFWGIRFHLFDVPSDMESSQAFGLALFLVAFLYIGTILSVPIAIHALTSLIAGVLLWRSSRGAGSLPSRSFLVFVAVLRVIGILCLGFLALCLMIALPEVNAKASMFFDIAFLVLFWGQIMLFFVERYKKMVA